MDGLNDAKRMVKTAEKWGHKAVAITDHGVVQAFPEASHAGKDIKILYGCEGYLLEDKDLIAEDGTINYKGRPTNHVIVFAKNKTGLKDLYRLVSMSHLNYFYKNTDLQKNYNYNMVAIKDKRPVLMGIEEILDGYIDHQIDVVTRASYMI